MVTVTVPVGRILITTGAIESVNREEVVNALARHCRGDWGIVEAADWRANDDALEFGARLLSAYETQDGLRFWIITEPDRSVTTVLLPDDY